ncbi:translation elongation factor Ts [candidate division WOR-1 bacterium RIFOXYA12_FULL_52_29]|uniref:Elongation factor Ts n=1 Tax=candidate division WOR-1 bacterium RIFOXYC12_FULL_54_18 TaxID=1802584 RepID=A0A1F4T9E0_UNCSA|nr:MAG: translation elongation factor Ts [candidate division WOR-1 bacterium RIFOXYA2_FULL_51_19]OGC18226.1 MAG: translation elongation factor Ts [candidate division WOR-1 bacterium RIFOXYA12_FULL_52_29]OGC27081.1 MAG: translation elongation factor Ts [candidate division WOR-1 bacterium RIFOXYB2_FULL_45_9]OGC28643.1 MAG: translation elongation factor Ts [candidate division WOR-1 bacterium RIFOXYC12_FULL_54_18]OGC30902.1 MAG: translation elongation factor Ts [candidate division WOR-1 bacterium R
MAITVEMITQLREKTGCGMMDCKAALNETAGDFDKAIELLRKKGMAAATKRAGRSACQGLVDSYIHIGGKIGVLVEVNCETDFVAKGIDFQAFVKDICMQIAASNPQYINREDVPADIIEREKEVLSAQTKEEGKPAAAIPKIVEGRLQKFYSEVCLMEQPFVKDPKVMVKDLLAGLLAKIGEKIVVRRFVRYQLGENS